MNERIDKLERQVARLAKAVEDLAFYLAKTFPSDPYEREIVKPKTRKEETMIVLTIENPELRKLIAESFAPEKKANATKPVTKAKKGLKK